MMDDELRFQQLRDRGEACGFRATRRARPT